jgi:hypothetical protein
VQQNSLKGLPRWQLNIIKKYPSIYLEVSPDVLRWYEDCPENLPSSKNFCNLRYGFEFREGWAKLVDEFSSKIDLFVKEIRKRSQTNAYVKALIFKQKMGRLTWQGTTNLKEPYLPFLRAFITEYENRSIRISEESGEPGELRTLKSGFGGYLCTRSISEFNQMAADAKLLAETDQKLWNHPSPA